MIKNITCLLFLFHIITGFCQQHVAYLNKNMLTTDSEYVFKRVMGPTDDSGIFSVEIFYKSGEMYSKGTSVVPEHPKYDGIVTTFYKSGNVQSTQQYADGKIWSMNEDWYENGQKRRVRQHDFVQGVPRLKILQFWKEDGEQTVIDGNGHFEYSSDDYDERGSVKNGFYDGLLKGRFMNVQFEETYSEGNLLNGQSVDQEGAFREYTVLEQKPEPKGGIQAFYAYISENFKVPRKNKEWGRIIVSFVVEKTGRITELKIVKGLSAEIDLEAIRVIGSSDYWTPAMQRGRTVRCAFTLPISIKK